MSRAEAKSPLAEMGERLEGAANRVVEAVQAHWKRWLVCVHIAKMIYWFRDVSPFSGLPLTNVDYVQFYGRIQRMAEFHARSGRIWGFDPFDMAGYVSGPFLEVGTHFLGLIAIGLDAILPVATTLLIVEVAALVFMPFIVFPIMRVLGASQRVAWTAFGFVVFTFGVCEPFSTLMYKLGLWGFMMCAFLSLLQVALMIRWVEAPSWKLWAGTTASAAVLFQLHPAALVIVLAPNAAVYLLSLRRLRLIDHAALALTSVIVVLANWYWMSAFLSFSHWRVTAPYYETKGLVDIFSRFGPVQGDAYRSVQALLNGAAVLLGIVAIRRLWTSRPLLARTAAIWIGWLFVVSFFGSGIPWVRTLQPGRNEFAFFLVLYLLSATVFESEVLSRRRPRIIAALLIPFLLIFMFERGPGISPWSKFAPPLRTELHFWQNDLIQYLRANPETDGRVLLECADDLNPHFADVVPPMTGAILLGGQHPGNFLITRSSLFTADWVIDPNKRSKKALAFSKPVEDLTDREFMRYLEAYNVTRVAARTDAMIAALDRKVGAVEPVTIVPPHHIYRVLRKPDWFIEGSGRVTFDYDRVVIEDASKGALTLKVHWFDTFVADPPAALSPVFVLDDPVPFVSIDNSAGHKKIELVNRGFPPFSERFRRWLKRERPW